MSATCRYCRRALAHGLCSTHEMRRRARQSLTRPVKEQRKYTDSEVREALILASDVGGNEAARDLGIPRSTIHNWLRGDRRILDDS